jgi:LAO/AO transport system kinase
MNIKDAILAGNVRAAAKLMRRLDDRDESAIAILKELYAHTGRAYILGITGPPGAGKSTLVDCLISSFRKKGLRVGVVAIDPTSPFSGGAILGDRLRMMQHANDPYVFIRSLATRGAMGGLSRSTVDVISVLDAFGKDIIIIETVGVGQDEVEIARIAHTSVVMTVPGLGDDIQAIKAGIMEIADIYVINKADRDGANKTLMDIRLMLEMKEHDSDWQIPLYLVEASRGKGIDELVAGIEAHREYLFHHPNFRDILAEKARIQLAEVIKARLFEAAWQDLQQQGQLPRIIEQISQRTLDPYSVADALILRLKGQSSI